MIQQMLEYLWTVGSTFLGCFAGGIITYVLIKRMTNTNSIIDKLSEMSPEFTRIVTEMLNKTENQKIFYAIGALIGQGARQGAGFGGKPGKFNLESMVGQFIMGIMNRGQGGGEQQPQQQQGSGDNPFG